jgi:hypothetical protein
MAQRARREFDLHAWAVARLGIRNLDGGRGYERGVRLVSCPLCDDAELDRGRGWINVNRKYCGCMNAGCPVEEGVPATEYVRRVEGYRTRTEALGMLLRDYPDFSVPVAPPTRLAAYADWCELPPSTLITEHPGRAPSLLYDESRAFIKRQWGLTARDAERWGLRHCVHGRHAFRIIIPIMLGGQLVGFQARTFRHAEPKYLTSVYGVYGERGAECGRPTEALLYNLDAVTEGCDVILVEGAGDVMAFDREESRRRSGATAGEAGFGAGSEQVGEHDQAVAVAILGLALTEEKAALLAAKKPGRVIIATDAERDAQARGRKMLDILVLWGLDVTTGNWVGAKDAGAGARLAVVDTSLRGLSAQVAARLHR